MAYKLAISNIVEVPINFTLRTGAGEQPFEITLVCDRIDREKVKEVFESKDQTAIDVLVNVTRGWKDQTLILDDTDQPAAFTSEAFAELLKVPGVAVVALNSYFGEISAKRKN